MFDRHGVRLERAGPIATITIDRPDKRNALDRSAMEALGEAVRRVREDDAIRGALVTGGGDRAFVAGADIGELSKITPAEALELSRVGQRVFREIELAGKPILAAVNGFALGGGCELALACHLRIASPEARFGLPEVKLGIVPGYGGTVRLPRLVGVGRALEMILTGMIIDAEEAYRIGLVNRIARERPLREEAMDMLETILENGPLALSEAVGSVIGGFGVSVEDAMAREAAAFGVLAATEDFREGVAAFLKKRAPRFEGR